MRESRRDRWSPVRQVRPRERHLHWRDHRLQPMGRLAPLLRPHRPYREKLLPYESGSPLFMDARVQFPMRYYIIAMLFVIFDIEVVFLFPWAVSLGKIGLFGFWSMIIFLGVLTVGFIYEWKKGALEWE